ncbi:MAG TPA: tautomerase family protein [Candidatus Methanofastidiosa archaeon]|nr:tautomerase family protein [Candidatus Methanofastidiosa archaeon]HPR42134.1 tautomerase family protein [Candidatus Methanofastidiosa archaeon]
MPTITIEGPRLDIEKKRQLGKELVDVARRVYGIENIIVLIKENSPENVCIDGSLLCDRMKKKE